MENKGGKVRHGSPQPSNREGTRLPALPSSLSPSLPPGCFPLTFQRLVVGSFNIRSMDISFHQIRADGGVGRRIFHRDAG